MALGAVSGQGPGCALLGGEEDEVWAPGKVPGRDEAEQIAPRVNWSWELHPWSSRTSATPRNLHLAPAWCRWEGASASPAAAGWALPCFHGRRAGRKPGGRPTIDVFVPGNSDEFTHGRPSGCVSQTGWEKNVITVALQHLRHTCLGNSIYPP